MPPHLFHAISDDPARWERQFGCMAALFQIFEHHPRFLRKRTRPPITSSADSHPPTYSKTSNKRPAVPSTKAPCSSKYGHNMESAHTKACASYNRKKGSSDIAPNYKTTSDCSAASKSKKLFKNESPSILDSSRATSTIRETPIKKSFERATSPDQCCSTTTPATCRSLPGSPQVRFSKARDSRSQLVVKSLFDNPRASLDGGQGQLAASPRISQRDQSFDGLCKDPLLELQDSIRALAKLQQATQQFVDSFEAQQHRPHVHAAADEPAKKCNSSSSSNWWNARIRKTRLFQSSHNHASQNSTVNCMEAAAARTSSFDYTEAIRISQKIEETPARLSLDGRELVPKAVMKLREALRLGTMSTETLKCSSSTSADQKKEHGLSLRSALATKEEFNFVKGSNSRPAFNSSECLADRGQRSNVIARLMGLDDLPPTKLLAAVDGDGNTKSESKLPFREPRLLKDLLGCPLRMDIDKTDINSRFAHHSVNDFMIEKPIRQYDAAMVSKLSKIEAASATVNNTAHAPPVYLQGAAVGVLSREEDCKVIGEVQIQRGKTNKQYNLHNSCRPEYNLHNSCNNKQYNLHNSCRPKYNLHNSCNLGPAIVLSKHALEVMPSPSLVIKRAAPSNHGGKTDHSEKEVEKFVRFSERNREKSLGKTEGNFCELDAKLTVAGAGSKANQRKQSRTRVSVGRSMGSMRSGVVRAEPLESAQQLYLHSHGTCTTNKEGSRLGGHALMEKSCNDSLLSLNCVSQDTESCVLHILPAKQFAASVAGADPSNLSGAFGPAASCTKLPTTRAETGVVLSQLEHPHVANGEAELRVGEEGLLNAPQFEYVEAILERAGLLADKEDEIQGHLGKCAIINPAIFLEIERSWTTAGSPAADNTVKVDSRPRRRLIFDCVNEILAGGDSMKGGSDGFKRGVLLAVWKELKRLVVAPPLTLPSTSTSSAPTSNKRVRDCWLLARDIEVEQSQDAWWRCSSSSSSLLSFSHHVSRSLEDAIFQDLLLELIASNFTL